MTATSQELEAEVDRLAGRLRLPYLRRAAAEVIPTGRSQRWDPGEVLRAVLAEEAAGRDAAGLANRRRRAGFPTGKTFDSWDTDASSVPTATEQALRSLEWIRRAENLAVIGPSGTGKSHLLEALGHAAVDDGLTVTWLEHPRPRPAGAPPPRRRQRRQGHPTGDPRRPDRHR
jgi:DNA replication protein DnaC